MLNTWPAEVPAPAKKPRLKLVGNDGNAFAILGCAHKAAKKAGWSSEQWTAFQTIAMSGDYDDLLGICCEYFQVS